jgi:hypothetical protein
MYERTYLETGPDYPGPDAPLAQRVAAGDRWHRDVYRATNAWIEAVTWIDVMEPYSQYVGDWSDYWESYRWQPLGGGHRAVGDARACLQVIKAMAETPLTIEQRLQYRGARVYDVPSTLRTA